MTKLYLARHGETTDNVNQIMQGQTQGELTLQGVRQAEELALKMKHTKLDVFVSSDLKRSIDTCRIVAKLHCQPVIQTSLLRERDWGGFTGRYIPDLKDEVWPDDIESIEALRRRANEFLQFIRTRYNGKCVFAVGHGIINKAIQAEHFGKAMKEIPRMANAEVRLLLL